MYLSKKHLGNILLSLDSKIQEQSYEIFIAPYLDKNVLNDFRSRINCYFENETKHIQTMKILPKTNFQEVIQTSIDYDGRRCYMYDKQGTLWILQAANPGGCDITFFQNPKSTEVLVRCHWGYDFD